MVRLKMIMLGLLLAAMSAVALIDQVTIDWYPPAGAAQDGRAVAYAPGDIRDCMGARAFSSLGEPSSDLGLRPTEPQVFGLDHPHGSLVLGNGQDIDIAVLGIDLFVEQ